MYVKDAVAKHFDELCRQRGICYNELANISGVPPTTVYCMMKPERRKLHIDVIKKLCDGLDITLAEFFSAPVFEELEQEILQFDEAAQRERIGAFCREFGIKEDGTAAKKVADWLESR